MSDTQITSPSVSGIIQNDVGLVICASDIVQNDAMLDSWSVHLTLYRMTPCWTRDLCIWHNTEWRHVGLVICVSDIIQNDDGLVICVSAIIQNDNMLDSWSVYLTLYWMTPRWTRDLCIWHYTEWLHVGLVICVSDIIENDDGLVICVSAIIQNDNMLDSWSVYLTLYRMMLDLWSVYLTLYRMDPCWTCDLCIWHYTEWLHVGLVIVYLTLYRMMPCWTNDLFI